MPLPCGARHVAQLAPSNLLIGRRSLASCGYHLPREYEVMGVKLGSYTKSSRIDAQTTRALLCLLLYPSCADRVYHCLVLTSPSSPQHIPAYPTQYGQDQERPPCTQEE